MRMNDEQARELVMTHIAKRALTLAMEGDWPDSQAQRILDDILAHPVTQDWIQQQIEMLTATRH